MSHPWVRLALACLLGMAATAAYAADSLPSKDAPDLTTVRAAINAKHYDTALVELKRLEVNYKQPDVYSLMGFALRKTGDRPQAMTYYRKALELDPTHKGALEYQGELYIEIGQIDKAKENLKKLDKLCWFGCEEEDDLKEAIETASKAK
jgi:tetratricopeptide (TPR) repeat protein